MSAPAHFPTSAEEFSNAAVQMLSAHGVEASVSGEGAWPALNRVDVTLVRASKPKPPPLGAVEERFRVARLSVRGTPVKIENAAVHVEAEATDVSGGFAEESNGAPWAVLRTAASASFVVEITKKELERVLHELVSAAVEKQGATVRSTVVEVSAPGPRTLEFAVHCTAKVFIASTTLSVKGRVEVKEPLTLRIDGLAVSGEGMIAGMAQSFLRPRLDEWNGKELHLAAMLPANLAVRDVRLSAGESVRVDASFGEAAAG